MRPSAVVPAYAALAALAATGDARPTGIGAVDALLLAAGAAGVAACARRARTIPVYVAAGTAAAAQPALIPMALGVAGLVAALALQIQWVRRSSSRRALVAACAGGLPWCAMAGAPMHPVATWWPVPVAAFAWVVVSARRAGGPEFQKRWNVIVGATAGATVVFTCLGAFAVLSARADVTRGANRLEAGLAAARSGETDDAKERLRTGASALARGDGSLDAIWAKPALLVPGVSQNLRSLHVTVGAASDVAGVATETADAVDLERFTASGGRIDAAAIAAVEEPMQQLVAVLEEARDDLTALEDTWMLPAIRSEIDKVTEQLTDASASAQLAGDGVAVIPELLGADGPTTYLVFFTSPVEARSRTGFPSNYAELRFDDGAFEMTRFGRIAELNALVRGDERPLDGPADYVDRYGRFGTHRSWQNITMSPDFPSIAEVARQLYPRATGTDIDGVLSVNPTALAALLSLTGPIPVPEAGITLNADNAEEFLFREQYLTFDTEKLDRIDMLEFVAEQAFEALETADLPGPNGLRRALGPAVDAGDLQFFAFEPAAAAFLDEVGITGRLPAFTDDFIAVSTSNAAGNKIDLFLERTVDYDVIWDPDTGQIDATATVTLTNTAPATGLPPYLIDNALGRRPADIELSPGSNYVFFTLYSPWGSTGATLDGDALGLERLRELGRYAYSTFITLAPGESRTLVVDLVGEIDDRTYDLDVATQPLITPETFAVSVTTTDGTTVPVQGLPDGERDAPVPLKGTLSLSAPEP